MLRHSTHWPRPPLAVVLHAGVGALQPELSARQATQMCWPAVSQIGVDPPHCPLPVHSTQAPFATSQYGVSESPAQSASAPQARHSRGKMSTRQVPFGGVHPCVGVQTSHVPSPAFVVVSQCGVELPESQPVLSARQNLQVFVVVLQCGAVPLVQVESLRHSTHSPTPPAPPTLQTGVGAAHPLLSARHALQVLRAVSQTGVAPPQVLLFRHWTHTPLPLLAAVSQTGVEPEQPAVAVQALQVWLAVSQMGVAPPQFVSVRQPTHWPPVTEVLHTGVAPEHPWVAVQVTQVRLASQTGVEPEQLPFERHWTHCPPATEVSHTGVAPEHPLVAVQVTHVRVVVLHTGVLPPQLELSRQATHCPPTTEVSQTGVAPEQPLVAVQVTHLPAPPLPSGSHTGVAPPQPAVSVQVLQSPFPLSAAVSQTGIEPEQPDVAVQATHFFAVVSHAGVVPPHCALERQPTHWPPATETSQTGVEPEQPRAAVQVTQAPLPPLAAVSQTGVAPLQPAIAVHALQVFVDVSQIGVAPPQAGSHVFEDGGVHVPPEQTQPAPFPAQSPSTVHSRPGQPVASRANTTVADTSKSKLFFMATPRRTRNSLA